MLTGANLIIPPACFFFSFLKFWPGCSAEMVTKIFLRFGTFRTFTIKPRISESNVFPSCESCLSDQLRQSCGRKASGETAFGESQEMSEHTWQMQMLPYGAREGALPSWVVGWVRKQRESYITAFTVTSSLPDTYESSWSDMTDKCRRSNRKCKTKKNSQ